VRLLLSKRSSDDENNDMNGDYDGDKTTIVTIDVSNVNSSTCV